MLRIRLFLLGLGFWFLMEICIETWREIWKGQKRIDVFEYSGKKTHLRPICVVFFLVFFAPSKSVLFQANGQTNGNYYIWKVSKVLDIRSNMGVSENNGTPKSSILIGFSIINHPFWVPLLLEIPIWWNLKYVKVPQDALRLMSMIFRYHAQPGFHERHISFHVFLHLCHTFPGV